MSEVNWGHPIHTFMEEHKIILRFAEELKNATEKIRRAKDFNSIGEEIGQLKHIAELLAEIEKHHIREENVLFPHLEKHGITQPPAIMWSEHNELRERKKKLKELLDKREALGYQEFVKQLEGIAPSIVELLSSHIHKENNILYQMALKTITANEWENIRRECDELGYCSFTPEQATKAVAREGEKTGGEKMLEGGMEFETGRLSKAEVEAIFNTLPVDVTFVDGEDTVRYFSKSRERIFPRTKAVLGLKVQRCHPQKSVHLVNQILEDFKNGRRDVAEFWIQKGGQLVYIRYFAMRDEGGKYLGCLEVTQDITNIKKIEGEKRLL